MARGGRTADADDAWRPSAEDAAIQAADEMLEEELMDEAPVERKSAPSSRTSPIAHHKKTSRRPKHQEDKIWKPIDEDFEAEELEV